MYYLSVEDIQVYISSVLEPIVRPVCKISTIIFGRTEQDQVDTLGLNTPTSVGHCTRKVHA